MSNLLCARKETHPDWVSVTDAKNKLSQLAQDYYQQRYPGCKINFGAEYKENVGFFCDKALGVYFRVQSVATNWPADTLVIANISHLFDREYGDVLSELFGFLIMIRHEVGFYNLGFENPGMALMSLIKRFGFEKIEHSEDYWTISMVALKERTEAGSIYHYDSIAKQAAKDGLK
ncbi:hypothetical protein N5C93_23410 [Pseudomonas nitroreducens]|uniref:hypothetical protein n=1 Tax=Pseudomonas nitroreducens TaxID=46680 RepID=UPI0014732113|nr:hypothetical protein [Pseudomonas nitroreducens]MDG9856954.1 hypothetical protein [Pseudomonas nitroreducens]MDH1075788.1 hypothetical protein [Pseudomonas nitroreducens]NMZ76399.1 hypothetical protein [Pseudomonas nitroreducens]